jgi:hypothetical protein
MITKTVTIDGTAWTINGDDRPNPLTPSPSIKATVDGATVHLSCQYRQISSTSHADGCTRWPCTCAPRPSDEAPLWEAAREVMHACSDAIQAAEEAERQARWARTDDEGYVRVRPGCDPCPSAQYGGPCTCC